MIEPTPTGTAVVDQLRAIRNQIADVTPLTVEQRKALRNITGRFNNEILQESINVGWQTSAGLRTLLCNKETTAAWSVDAGRLRFPARCLVPAIGRGRLCARQGAAG